MNYQKDPEVIYQQSFASVRREASLSRFPGSLRAVVERIVHACGMTDIADDIDYSDGFAESARGALNSGAPILCDSAMTAAGIMRGLRPDHCEVIAPRFDESLAARAREAGTTRSAVIAESWKEKLGGAVAVIGSAPTALFRLLELLDEGAPEPAAVVGFPVGFVGAAESKMELARRTGEIEFLTIAGRRGGSAMAAAAVNALLIQARAADGI